jgi:hypothetical protein
MADGFLGRWSERKQALRQGKAIDEELHALAGKAPAVSDPQQAPASAPLPTPAAPTLEEAQALSSDSDFRPFVSRELAPEVRNTALKKLFADPHFGVMDRMDVYIDDYSQADPLPESMLRKMASASFLGLFQDEPDPAKPVSLQDNKVREAGNNHDDTDLRLQPNDGAGREESGSGTE